MVTEQVAARGIRDPRVLAVLRTVPRHRFVPAALQHRAYDDTPLVIGEGQTISQPYIVALMSELADLQPGERVLEVGTGSGYQTAVLAEIVGPVQVYTIEISPTLAAGARRILDELGYAAVHTRVGDGSFGWPDAAPFDAILVAAAPDRVPQPLLDQLAPQGRLVIPVGPSGVTQILQVFIKRPDGGIEAREIIPVSFVPLYRPDSS